MFKATKKLTRDTIEIQLYYYNKSVLIKKTSSQEVKESIVVSGLYKRPLFHYFGKLFVFNKVINC